MSAATTGRAREHKVRDHLESHGWLAIMRSAASKGPADLLLAHPDHGAALVQVGTENKRLGPFDRRRFLNAADLCGALPLVAICAPRQEPVYLLATRDKPGTWQTFDVTGGGLGA